MSKGTTIATLVLALGVFGTGQVWSEQKPKDDFAWIRGANYVPSYAKNDVAIWMDFDPAVIDREMGYASRLKLNTVRIFLSVQVYEKNPALFLERFEQFLAICDKHKIRMMPVLFDSCFDPQEVDITEYRDKNWIPSPGFHRLGEKDRPALAAYTKTIVSRYKADKRIVIWDIMNEPDITAHYRDWERGGRQTIDAFVRWALGYVREQGATQPLTVGWADASANIAVIDLVDVISMHTYCGYGELSRRLQELQHWGKLHNKPVILSEFVGRPQQPIEQAVPIAVKRKVGWFFWELMLGKTQFSQGRRPYQGHLYPDGTCYSAKEVAAILCPEGYTEAPEVVAERAGFRISDRAPKGFVEEGISFTSFWERWNGNGPNRGRLWFTAEANETAAKEVEGRRVVLTLKFGLDCGIVAVTVDGKPAAVATLDTYSAVVDWDRKVVVADNLTPGKHKVVVTATGRKAAASTHAYIQLVDIDGHE